MKVEASFVADDPWNANRRDTFALDYDRHVIRSELSGVARDLPDSLYFAWRAGRISAESLPRLLHQLQPTLQKGAKGDYGIGLSTKVFTAIVWTMVVWMAAADAVWIDEILTSGMPLVLAIFVVPVFPLIVGRIFYRAVYRVWRRRMDQTKWILARA
jgi:hypothetical protein